MPQLFLTGKEPLSQMICNLFLLIGPITLRYLGATGMSQREALRCEGSAAGAFGCGRQFKVGEAPLFIRDNGLPHNGTSLLLHYQRNSLFQEQEHNLLLLKLSSCKGWLKKGHGRGNTASCRGYIWEFDRLYAWFTHFTANSALPQFCARGHKTSSQASKPTDGVKCWASN